MKYTVARCFALREKQQATLTVADIQLLTSDKANMLNSILLICSCCSFGLPKNGERTTNQKEAIGVRSSESV
jgi:hypothetical protein